MTSQDLLERINQLPLEERSRLLEAVRSGMEAPPAPKGRRKTRSRPEDPKATLHPPEIPSESLWKTVPVPLWEEDFSQVRDHLSALGLLGQTPEVVREHLNRHPETLQECVAKVRIIDFNPACLRLHGAREREQLFAGLDRLICEESRDALIEQLVAISTGMREVELDTKVRTLDGEILDVRLHWGVASESVESFRRMLVSTVDITEHKRAQKALTWERNRLRRILDGFNQGVYMVNQNYEVEYMNPVFEREFGQVLGRKCHEYLHNRADPCPWCTNGEITAGRTIQWELTLPTTGRTYELYDTPIENEDGSLSKLEFVHDITEHRRAQEKALLLQEIALGVGEAQDLNSAFEFVLERVCKATGWMVGEAWVPSRDGRRLECHRTWHAPEVLLDEFKHTSVEHEFAPGEGLPGRVWAERAPHWIEDICVETNFPRREAALRAGLKAALGVPVTANGEVVLVMDFLLFEPRPKDPPMVELISAVAAQIGLLIARKRAAEALAREQAFSDSIIRSLPGVFYLFDEQGRFVRWNENFEQVSGYSRAEMAERHPLDFFVGEEKELIRARIERVFEEGAADAEADLVAKNDSRTPYYFTGVRVVLEGRPHVVGMGVDITQQKQAQERLDRNLRELAALHGIGLSLSSGITLDRVVRSAVDGVVEATHAELVMFFLMTEEGLKLQGCGPKNSAYRHDTTATLRVGECLCGVAAKEKKAVYSSDIFADTRCTRSECKDAGIRSFTCLPLISEGQILGALSIASAQERDFEGQALFLEAIAVAASISLRNALLYEKVSRHAAEMESEVAARKQAEASLREAWEFLETALVQSPSGILIASAPDVTIRMANPAAFRIRGGDQKLLTGIDVSQHSTRWQTYRPDGTPYSPEELPLSRAVLRGETTEDEEVIIRDEQGIDRWVSVNAAPIRDAEGQITDGIVIFHDISERKRAQQSLRDLSLAVNASGDMVFMTDREGVFTSVNPPFTDLYGYSPEELVGKVTPRILKSGKQSAEVYEQFWQSILRGELFRGVVVNRARDGSEYSIEETVSPFRDDLGNIAGFLAIQRNVTERKMAEEALQAAKAEMQVLLENARDFIYRHDADGVLNYLSPSVEQISGRTPTEWTRHYTAYLTDNPINQEAVRYTEKTLRTGLEAPPYPIEIYHRDGRRIMLEVTERPYYEGGKVAGIIGIARDITERMRTEAEIQHLAAFPQNSPNPIVEFQPDGTLHYSNHAFIELVRDVGASQAEQLLPWDAPAIIEDCLGAGQSRLRVENQVEGRVLSWSFFPIRETGTVYGYATDITERKRAEESLKASEALFRALIENASDLITVVNQEGLIRFQGPSSQRLLGYPPEVMTGRPAFDWIHPEDAPRVRDAIGRALVHPEKPIAAEFRLRHRDGTSRVFEAIGRSLPEPSGEAFIIVNSRDVTEHRRLEEQLRQSQKMEAIGQLAGGVAHDFNNILAAVMMQAELLQVEVNNPEEIRSGVKQILSSAHRAANLTRQLLLFSRKQVMQSRDLDLNEVVTSVTKMLQRLIGEDVRLQLHLHPTPLLTHADSGMLDQALLNLAVNARDAMPQGGRLVIETGTRTVDEQLAGAQPDAAPGQYVFMSVSDTGIGISPENLPRIFEPFFTTKEPGKGTGLGLATVFGIVKQHRGWLQVESKPQEGTRVQVLLPAGAASGTATEPEAAKFPARGGTETILLVEDEPEVRRLASAVLARHGYRVLEAAHGHEALQMWEQYSGRIQLLLTDLVLPEGLSGHDLAARLRKRDPYLRILFTSGHSAEIAGRELNLQPGQTFLRKPTPSAELLEAVRRSLDS